MSALPEISSHGAARFGLLLDAAERGNRALVAEMLMSIPADDLAAIDVRLRWYGIDPKSLLTGTEPR